ncbi:MAG: class I SAM-dependent methyltransferase [Proteobacteria bacterium]|nr:class I SAM-dependent methyltransferase [Pseudomonadota bacterium]
MATVRDSGMPPQQMWESFFDVPRLLDALQCRDLAADIVEFGCGYGTFTLPAAQRTRGQVYALDIDPHQVAATAARARTAGIANVNAQQRDFVDEGCGRPAGSAGFAMLFNILHMENPAALLAEAYRVLQPGAVAGVIHWKHGDTPRGPPLEIRPTPAQIQRWALSAGFTPTVVDELPGNPWHFGLVLRRPGESIDVPPGGV